MIFSEIIKKAAAFPDKYVLTNPVSKKWIQIQFKKIPTAIQHTPPAVFIPDDRAFLKAAYTLLEPFLHVLLCMKIYRNRHICIDSQAGEKEQRGRKWKIKRVLP